METNPYAGQMFRWTLKETMDRYGVTRYALQQKTGLAMNTVRAMYDGTPTRVDLPAIDRVISVLSEVTGREIVFSDVLEWRSSPGVG